MSKVLLVGDVKDVENLKVNLECKLIDKACDIEVIKATDTNEMFNYKYVVYTGKVADVAPMMKRRIYRMDELKAKNTLTMYYADNLRDFQSMKEVDDWKADHTCKWVEHFNDEELRTELINWLAQYAIVNGIDADGLAMYKKCCNPKYYAEFQDKVNAYLQDTKFDTYNAGHVTTVQKGHTWTCQDSNNHYLNKGQTSVHTENRTKDVYEVTFLENLKNYCTIKWCVMLGVDTDDNHGRPSEVASNYEKMIIGLDF